MKKKKKRGEVSIELSSIENGSQTEKWFPLKNQSQVIGHIKIGLQLVGIHYSVLDYAISSDQNSLKRKTMEDRHVLIDKFGGNKNHGYFAIYDGHGGVMVSELLADLLHPVFTFSFLFVFFFKNEYPNLQQIFLEELEQSKSIETVFKKSFERTDAIILEKVKPTAEDIAKTAFRRPPDSKGGSTATVAFIQTKGEDQWLHIGNVGDTGAVLNRNGTALLLTKEDKTTNPEEKKRLEDAECSVWKNRVWGTLSVTRSFGDFEFKQWVISEPHFQSIKLEEGDSFLILACDGVKKQCFLIF